MIYIINFPFCNLHSIQRYFLVRNLDFCVIHNQISFKDDDFVLLPGVGTFGEGSLFLQQSGLDVSIKGHANAGGSLLGICLGMQLLLSSSEESLGFVGLDILSGKCLRIPSSSTFRVPHIGWNSLSINAEHSILSEFTDLTETTCDFYFVHSYFCSPLNSSSIIASFYHPSGNIPAIVSQGNVIGIQFHPEKSGKAGYKLLDHIFLP